MGDSLHDRAASIFLEVRDLDPDARAERIEERCRENRDLRHEVESLLSHDGVAATFLSMPAMEGGVAGTGPPPVIQGYELIEPLGEGGFAVVYLAEQSGPLRRRVALKVLKRGMDSDAVLARFGAERQVVASMNHPGIATVYDAGAADDGRPFFAMEHVAGPPITEFCRDANLADRLRLFLDVCDAVQHAHQKGVIHRDLKPTNILVGQHDGDARIKVIDFGIAKAVDPSEAPQHTTQGQLIGTPSYMSPEQTEGLDLDIRTDIYSLGVLLFELLTDRLPFDEKALRSELHRRIREDDPPRPSSLRSIPTELDWIVRRAMEKDRTKRYPTTDALRADIVRHLERRPIEAGPPTTSYRMKRFVQRHRTGVAAASLLLGAMVAGTVTTAWQAFRAARAESAALEHLELAQEEAATAGAVSAFLQDILASSDPRHTSNPDLTVKEALDLAAERFGDQFADRPLVEASLRGTIGETYRSLGFPMESVSHLERSEALFRAHAEESDRRRLTAVSNLAILYKSLNRLDEAERLFAEDLRLRAIIDGPEAEDTLAAEVNYARLLEAQGDWKAAESRFVETLDVMRRALGESHVNTLVTSHHLATLYLTQDRFAESAPLFERAIAQWRERGEGSHPYAIVALANLATLYDETGRNEDALRMREEGYEASLSGLGDSHPTTMGMLTLLAQTLRNAGRGEEALPRLQTAIEKLEERLGPNDAVTISTIGELARTLNSLDRYDEGYRWTREALDRALRTFPDQHPSLATYFSNMAYVAGRTGRVDEQIAMLEQAIAIHETTGSTSRATLRSNAGKLAELYEQVDRGSDAAALRERHGLE